MQNEISYWGKQLGCNFHTNDKHKCSITLSQIRNKNFKRKTILNGKTEIKKGLPLGPTQMNLTKLHLKQTETTSTKLTRIVNR